MKCYVYATKDVFGQNDLFNQVKKYIRASSKPNFDVFLKMNETNDSYVAFIKKNECSEKKYSFKGVIYV